ncbi:MAG: hypothetical protein AAGJ91_19665 [Pseudomonadota bacterium]
MQLTVRNLDPRIAAALKARASRAGRSAEAEHRRILEETLLAPDGSEFFDAARARRIKLRPNLPDTTALLQQDRNRS